MRLLNAIIDGLQAKFPPARATLAIMTCVTPIVGLAAAVATAWVAVHFPSLPAFSPAEVTALALGGLAAVVAPAVRLGYKYIDGWQLKEEAERNHRHHMEVEMVHAGHFPPKAEAILNESIPPATPTEAP